MALVTDLYSGDYIVAAQLPQGRRITAVIVAAEGEVVGQGINQNTRIVLELRSSNCQPWPKKVVCNKTNAMMLSAAFGNDSNGWRNRPIEVWQELVQYQGRLVPGIRLAPIAAPPGTASPPAATSGIPGDDGLTRALVPPLVPPRPVAPGSSALPDDSIPF